MTMGPFEAFGDRVLAHARASPDRRAAVCDGRSLTYGELAARALAIAGGLRAGGIESGGAARVGLLAGNSLEFVAVFLAAQFAGVAIVPLPGLITPDAQARMIDDAAIAVLFHDAGHAEAARAAVGQTTGCEPPSLVCFDAAAEDAASLGAWLAGSVPAEPVSGHPEWASDLIYSSGTTGTPKGIVQSRAGRAAQSAGLAGLGVGPGVQLLDTVGLYSNFGVGALMLSLWWGGALHMMRKFSAATMVETLAREAIDIGWFAPATLIRTLEAEGFAVAVADRPCIKLCAGAPLSEAHKRQVLDAWPGPFFDLYGQTETGTLTLLPIHQVPHGKLGSVGALLPTVQVRILDDAGRPVAFGEEGEIAGHSLTLMSGYHQREDANAAAWWTDEIGRPYIRTGDVGRLDADGFLWLCDRKKDMIISGGFNIYPADIERVLAGHPSVFEAAVVGFPSAKWGESPVAFITLREGPAVEAETLRAWANERLGSFQRLAAVKVLPELPSGTMGKILKRELRQRFADDVGVLA